MKHIFWWGSAALVVMGCTHGAHPRGSIAAKSGNQEALVCIGPDEVKPGDKVALFDSRCKEVTHGRAEYSDTRCEKIRIGEGEVVRTLDDHYSVIKVAAGIPLKEGTVVEKR